MKISINAREAHRLPISLFVEKLFFSNAISPEEFKKKFNLDENQELIAVKQSAELWQLLKIMNGENSRHSRLDVVPVVAEDKSIVGYITREDLKSKMDEKLVIV
jgi:predicted transcriptional regulator